MTDLAAGATLNDRYKLENEIGRGGMGTVYRGHDPQLERRVAIKILSSLALGTEGQQRLVQEARSIAQLNHPNIVAVHDVGEVDQTPFIVMELVEGEDLHRSPPEELAQVVAIAQQVCLALQHAHDNQILHRDLKPENVLVASDGTVKLVDFGIARSMASRLTSEGQITGTVYYLAPELALGHPADGRADLYSLGVMLYELVTGSLPFTSDDPLAVVSQHVNAPPVPPRARTSDVPPRLEALILKLLNKDPADRLPTAAAVIEALDDPELLDPAASTDQELAVLGRIARGRFVGRQKEIKQARSIWMQTIGGTGQTLLISGEPGIGKSSLTRELATQAEVSGGMALVGECYAEGGAPYSPFSQMVRRVLPLVGQNGSGLSEIVLADLMNLTPELRPRYPQLPELPALDPESEQRRLSESMVSLLSALISKAPILLVLEDAHWADSGSLAMLRYVARRMKDRPLMLVATYREVELDQSLPLQETLVELNRERSASRLKLGRLDQQETGRLLEAIFQEEITPEFLKGIYRETEGNPFFIEEVCKALVEDGKLYFEDGRWHRPDMAELEIPQSVRVAIQSRLARLSEPVQDSLQTAAILGQEFDFDTLVAASDLEEDALIDALEAAERAQLAREISSDRGGTFRFVHALIATTLMDGLSGLRRRRMHHQAASAIEKLRPDDFEALAHHYYESGDLDKGLEYLLRAGARALGLSAHIEARRHFDRALEIAVTDGHSEALLAVQMGLGEIEGVADFNLALDHYAEALKLARDPIQQAIIKVKIGRLQAVTGDERGFGVLQQAADALDPDTHGNDWAQAIASIGRFHHNRGQHRKAIEQLERAREIAEPLGDVSTLIYVYTFLAGAYQHLGEFDQSNTWAEREIELGQRAKYAFMEAVGYEYLAENNSFMGQWERALEYAQLDGELGVNNGLLERERWAHLVKTWAYRSMGKLNAAIEAGSFCLEQAESAGDARLAVLAGEQLVYVHADRGEFDNAQQHAEISCARASELEQAYMIVEAQAALSYIRGLQGDWKRALAAAEAGMKGAEGTDNRLIPMVGGPLLAEALLEVGRLDESEQLLQQVLAIARESKSSIAEIKSLRVLGRLLGHRGEVEPARDAFTRALDLCDEWKSTVMAGRVLLDWASLEADSGDQVEAMQKLEQAQQVLGSTDAGYWTNRMQARLDELSSESPQARE